MALYPTTKMSTHTAITNAVGVVLAGGKSSRMGRDKAELCLDGEPLLLRAERLLRSAGCSTILLSGSPRCGWSEDAVSDVVPHTGPVGGMISSLRALADRSATPLSVLFVPIDTPYLSPEFLRAMLENSIEDDGCAIIGSPLPVVLRTTKAVLTRCTEIAPALTTEHSTSIRHFLKPLNLCEMAVPDAIQSQFFNINTPEDWDEARREFKNHG